MGDYAVDEADSCDPAALSSQLRVAREGYQRAIRAALDEAGFEDLSAFGVYVLDGMYTHNQIAELLARQIVQPAERHRSLLIELVRTGYLMSAAGRQRFRIADRGRAAAEVIEVARQSVDVEIDSVLTPAEVHGLRTGLAALARIAERNAPAEAVSTD